MLASKSVDLGFRLFCQLLFPKLIMNFKTKMISVDKREFLWLLVLVSGSLSKTCFKPFKT